MPQPALPTDMSLMRIVAQGLVPATAASTPREAVHHLLAVQGQQVSALPHALISRCPTATGTLVKQHFDAHELIRSRPMRGTVHITTAEDYRWMRLALLKTPLGHIHNYERELGIDEHLIRDVAQLIWELIAQSGGAIERRELLASWRQLVPASLPEQSLSRWSHLLLYRLDREGAIVEAPLARNQHLFIDARALPQPDDERSGFVVPLKDGDMTDEGRNDAFVEIARRYAYGHGPIGVSDLARWTAHSATRSLFALEEALNRDPRLVRLRLDNTRLLHCDRPRSLRESHDVFYMRADLLDITAEQRKDAERILFLASFDELHVGYKNRTCLTDEAGEHLICPARNGMFRPLLVHRGKLVAVRPVSDGLIWKNEPGPRLISGVDRAVAQIHHRLGR
ncbi:winged helix DNA-binding domain-containing protein [Arcanobacterium haemolyticum]|nr:winged helix DNA-binding domain-containing protein [Arcanobacterium haemolyticum]